MEKSEDTREKLLLAHGIRPTAVRLLICGVIESMHDTFSITDIEMELDSVDRSSIFRAVSLFADHHLLHVIDDGSGQKKYCLCHNDHQCRADEMHCHFHCERCHKTFCLENTHVPIVSYPEGFRLDSVEYLMHGLCRSCAAKEA